MKIGSSLRRCGAGGYVAGGLIVPYYEVAPDGKHFVMLPLDEKAAAKSEHLTFVLNWFTELERLLPKK